MAAGFSRRAPTLRSRDQASADSSTAESAAGRPRSCEQREAAMRCGLSLTDSDQVSWQLHGHGLFATRTDLEIARRASDDG